MIRGCLVRAAAGCAFAALLSLPASAASILVDQGDNTFDPGTGLAWLDLTLTAGQDYDDVLAGFGNYTTTGGYHFASANDLKKLFNDAGATGPYTPKDENTLGGGTGPIYDAATILLSLLGATDSGPGFGFTEGLLSDTPLAGSPLHQVAEIQAGQGIDRGGNPFSVAHLDVNETGQFDSDAEPLRGSFLVKSVAPAPLPAALPLFLSAIGGLGFVAWRRKVRG